MWEKEIYNILSIIYLVYRFYMTVFLDTVFANVLCTQYCKVRTVFR